jgi:hypothetical protein
MRKDIFKDCHWEKHGDYYILHNEWGRAVGILLTLENEDKEMGKDGRTTASAI